MENDVRKLERAIEIMQKTAEGVNPFTGETQEDFSFMNDPRMVRCLYFAVEILQKHKNGDHIRVVNRRDLPFAITQEDLAKVVLPDGPIGVNTFAKAVNEVIDPSRSKTLTGMALNNQLKKMGILGEAEEGEGKHRTVLTDSSVQYGIESMEASFNGKTYEKIVFNEKGKRFLLEHLDGIMSYKGEEN